MKAGKESYLAPAWPVLWSAKKGEKLEQRSTRSHQITESIY